MNTYTTFVELPVGAVFRLANSSAEAYQKINGKLFNNVTSVGVPGCIGTIKDYVCVIPLFSPPVLQKGEAVNKYVKYATFDDLPLGCVFKILGGSYVYAKISNADFRNAIDPDDDIAQDMPKYTISGLTSVIPFAIPVFDEETNERVNNA